MGSLIPDLRILGSSGEALAMFEFKNEFSGVTTDPTFQAISYYVHTQVSHEHHHVPLCCCFPV